MSGGVGLLPAKESRKQEGEGQGEIHQMKTGLYAGIQSSDGPSAKRMCESKKWQWQKSSVL